MKTLREQYRDLDEGQRKKVVWGAVALAVFILFFKLPPIIIVRPRPVPAPEVHKPSPLAPPVPVAPAPPPIPGAGELKGKWFAESVFPGRASVCALAIEIKDQKEPGRIAGYSTLRCRPLTRPSIVGARGSFANSTLALGGQMDAAAEILSGGWEGTVIKLHGEQGFVNSTAHGCAITDLTATSFGSNKMAVKWLDGSCGGGELVLARASG